jgi:Ni/Co efflux regulator RcnB
MFFREIAMKSLVLCVFGLGVVAFSSNAWADKPHHGGGGGGHQSRPAAHQTAHKTTTVHRSAPAHRKTVHRTVTIHHANRNTTHKKVIVHRKTVTHRNVTVRAHANLKHFHQSFRAPHRYRIGAWNAPRGFSYRRFGIGERIPALLLISTYFLTDYALYGLEAPDDGYIWVRDGSDAVLVDRETGEVVEVEYDVFY